MRKYWTILKVSLSERLVYRTDVFIASFLRFIPIVTTIMLWRAIYDGSGRQQVAGLQYEAMVSYYLFIMITRAFSSMPGVASGIASDVREGGLRKFLLQPLDYITYLFTLRVAHKSVLYLMALIPYISVFVLCREYLPGMPSAATLSMYICSLVLAFILGFVTHCFVGMLSFWFLEINSFVYIFMVLSYFLSGHMFPLNLLPGVLGDVILALPFAYETYYPTMIVLGELSAGESLNVLMMQLLWICILGGATRVAWRRGLRNYAAFGG